jgi:hypothetical protein
MEHNQVLPRRCHGPPVGTGALPREAVKPSISSALHAPEWTLTITGKSPHKALNLVQDVQIHPKPARSSKIAGFRGRIGRIWKGDSCHDVVTDARSVWPNNLLVGATVLAWSLVLGPQKSDDRFSSKIGALRATTRTLAAG